MKKNKTTYPPKKPPARVWEYKPHHRPEERGELWKKNLAWNQKNLWTNKLS